MKMPREHTHWEGCWRERTHHECALVRIKALEIKVEAREKRVEAREAELAAERERREAAEWVLKEIRIRLHAAGRRPEECWEMSEIDGHFAHFAHYKD